MFPQQFNIVQIAGVVFPVPILLLIPAREYLLPRIFGRKNLAVLDPAPYEGYEGQPKTGRIAQQPFEGPHNAGLEMAGNGTSVSSHEVPERRPSQEHNGVLSMEASL